MSTDPTDSTAPQAGTDVLDGWELGVLLSRDHRDPIYRQVAQGPAVIVMHEIPGITPLVAQFANEDVVAPVSPW
jgi:hypothetical protein